jgi:carbonic anhydrase
MKFFHMAAAMVLALAAGPLSAGDGSGVSAKDAWNLLRDGNERFARGMAANPHTSVEHRNQVIESQSPFAVVLACSDSRVPVERVMDAGVGDLYTVRVAGNAATGDIVIGSIEYGVLKSGAKLVVVLGHEECDTVKDALKGSKNPGTSIDALNSHVKAAADNAMDTLHDLKGQALVAEAVERNVLMSMRQLLESSPKIAEKVQNGEVKVVGGVYSLHTGRISWLGEHPSQKEILEGKTRPQDKAASQIK